MILFVVLGIIMVKSIDSIVDTNQAVDETHLILEETAGVVRAAVDMETSMRGYLLAGKEDFLDPYLVGVKQAYLGIENLKSMLVDSPEQIKALNEIRDVLTNWQRRVLEPNITLRREIGDAKTMNDLAKLVAQNKGKDFFDKFRSQIKFIYPAGKRIVEITSY